MAAMSPNEYFTNHVLSKRDCVDCPPTTPSCPSCPSGQVCVLTPQSCTQCAHMQCVSSSVPSGGSSSSGPNVGAIAGGVVGGVAFIAILTFVIWWFWIRPRRNEEYEEDWEEEDEDGNIKSQFQQQRDDRRSVHSVASTVLSRASNMIPIAFIPGVTNRDGNHNAPPVPPIPAARTYSPSPLSSQVNNQDAIFFSPGDLRNSAYSDASSIQNRDTMIGRHSISPSLARDSVASDVFRDNAQNNPMPAQTVTRARPNMVSVKTGGSAKSSPSIPGDSSEHDFAARSSPAIAVPSSSDGVSSPSIYSAKATPVTIFRKGSPGRFPIKTSSPASTSTSRTRPAVPSPLTAQSVDETDDEDDEPHARARQSLLNNRESSSTIQDSTAGVHSPFSDSSAAQTPGGLTAVIEEATRRASLRPQHAGLGGLRDQGPFGDEHESTEEDVGRQ